MAPLTLLQVTPSVLTCHWTVGAGAPLAAAVKLTLWPAVTLWPAGLVVMAGAVLAVRMAAFVVADPPALEKTARYWLPFCELCAAKVSVGDVAPLTLLHVTPSVLTCHCTVGAGVPLAAAVKLTLWPAATLWPAGLVVTAGAVLAVRVAALVVADPPVLVKTARYLLPFCEDCAVKVRVGEVAPLTFVQFTPSVLLCHRTVGEGVPVAAAVKVTEPGAQTVWLAG